MSSLTLEDVHDQAPGALENKRYRLRWRRRRGTHRDDLAHQLHRPLRENAVRALTR